MQPNSDFPSPGRFILIGMAVVCWTVMFVSFMPPRPGASSMMLRITLSGALSSTIALIWTDPRLQARKRQRSLMTRKSEFKTAINHQVRRRFDPEISRSAFLGAKSVVHNQAAFLEEVQAHYAKRSN